MSLCEEITQRGSDKRGVVGVTHASIKLMHILPVEFNINTQRPSLSGFNCKWIKWLVFPIKSKECFVKI